MLLNAFWLASPPPAAELGAHLAPSQANTSLLLGADVVVSTSLSASILIALRSLADTDVK